MLFTSHGFILQTRVCENSLGTQMNHQTNQQLHSQCEKAFAQELARTITAVLKNETALSNAQRESLCSTLIFSICAHLSGSSFGGCIDDTEIYPVVGYSLGESDDTVYFGSSRMHELVSSILKEQQS
jgi:hypothetical protein